MMPISGDIIFAVVQLVNEDELIIEQAVLDKHTDMVTDIMDRLEQLLPINLTVITDARIGIP